MEIIAKGQTETQIIVTIAIEKEPLKIPMAVDVVDVNNMSESEIKQIIKDGL